MDNWIEAAPGVWTHQKRPGWRIERDGTVVVLIRPAGPRRRFRDVRAAVFYAATVPGP